MVKLLLNNPGKILKPSWLLGLPGSSLSMAWKGQHLEQGCRAPWGESLPSDSPVSSPTSVGTYLDLCTDILPLVHRDEVGANDDGCHVIGIQHGDLQHRRAHQVSPIPGLEVGVVDGASLSVQQVPVVHQQRPGGGVHHEGIKAVAYTGTSELEPTLQDDALVVAGSALTYMFCGSSW